MGTPATSAASTEYVQQHPAEAEALLRISPQVTEDQARAIATERQERLRKILGQS